MNPKIDEYISKVKNWQQELQQLRMFLLECGLEEEIKWKKPCYMFQDANVIILYELKDCCAIGFMKGSLLQDNLGLLLKPGENSQAGRWMKFTNLKEIQEKESVIKNYIFEAIEIEKEGLKVDFSANKILVFPPELIQKFEENPAFKSAFESLTIGRQRAYNLFFTGAAQSKTIIARIEKYQDRIMKGKGINDCVCGLSKKYPNCDGSHKTLEKK